MRVLYMTYRESLLGGASLGVIQTQVRDLLDVLAKDNDVRWLAVVGAEARGTDAHTYRLPREDPVSSRWHAIRAVRDEVRRFRPDVVHARSYNAATIVVAARTGVPVVFDPRSLMPDERIGYGGASPTSPRSRAWHAVERLLVRHTAATVGVSPTMTEHLARHARGLARPPVMETIPLAADSRRFRVGTRDDVRAGLGLGSDDVLVVYAGSLTAADPAYLKAQFSRIEAGTPGATFLVLTRDDPAAVAPFPARTASYDEMPGYLAAADWGVIARKPATLPVLNRVELTTKFVEYVCAGLPVVVGAASTWLAEVVTTHDLGVVADISGEPITLRPRDPRDRQRIAEVGAAEYDIEVVAAAYRKLYEQVVARG